MPHHNLVYRLTQWPELEDTERTAPVLRAFSRMSVEPVTSGWFLRQTRMCPEKANALVQRLLHAGALECTDGHGPARAEQLAVHCLGCRAASALRALGALLACVLFAGLSSAGEKDSQLAVAKLQAESRAGHAFD
jgi:hypothetical protein